jgi:hypothetical protein
MKIRSWTVQKTPGTSGFPTGIIASLPLRGEAQEVVVEGSTTGARKQTAYLATGDYGLAIIDVSRFNLPLVLGQLNLEGRNDDVAVDSRLQIAAIAGGMGGLHLVDVSDSMMPKLLRTIDVETSQVEVVDGLAWITAGDALKAYDLLTGEPVDSITLPTSAPLSRIGREGTKLYAYAPDPVPGFTTDSKLFVVELASGEAQLLGELTGVPGISLAKLVAANDVVYLTGSGSEALITIDVSDPTAPQFISAPFFDNPAQGLALNGSGLALLGVPIFGGGIGVFDVTDLENTNEFLFGVPIVDKAHGVAIASGIAFVAGGFDGVDVINYLPFDNNGQAPTVTISSTAQDADGNAPGIQVLEGSSIPIRAQITDDVQVRNAELLVNGQVVRNDVSFPFDFSALALAATPEGTSVTVQVRATDTGGNAALSAPLVFELIPDTVAPAIVRTIPANAATVSHGLQRIEVAFSEPMAAGTINADNFVLRNGQEIEQPLRNVQLRGNDRIAQFFYDPLPVGDYTLTVAAAAVTDRAGNPLGAADATISFNLLDADNRWTGAVNMSWNEPGNWSGGQVPGALDDVTIDLDGDYTIVLEEDAAVRSLTLGADSGTQTLNTSGFAFAVSEFAEIGENAVFEVDGLTLPANAMLSGAGIVRFTGLTSTIAGLYNITGRTEIAGGDVTFSGSITSVGKALTIADGAADFGANDVSVRALALAPGGTLDGTGTIEVGDSFEWTGGTMQGTGTTRIRSGAVANVTNANALIDRTLENAGTLNFIVADAFELGFHLEDGTICNLPDGVIEVQAMLPFELTGTGMNLLDNQGLLRLSGGQQALVSIPFTNSGTVEIDDGVVGFSGGGTASGDFTIASGAALGFGGDYTLELASSITGAGHVLFESGTIAVLGQFNIGGNAGINTATVRLAGDATVGGNFQQTGGVLRVEISGRNAGEFDRLHVTGAAALGGTLEVEFSAGFAPVAGDAFEILHFGLLASAFDAVSALNLPEGLSLQPDYNADKLVIRIT